MSRPPKKGRASLLQRGRDQPSSNPRGTLSAPHVSSIGTLRSTRCWCSAKLDSFSPLQCNVCGGMGYTGQPRRLRSYLVVQVNAVDAQALQGALHRAAHILGRPLNGHALRSKPHMSQDIHERAHALPGRLIVHGSHPARDNVPMLP